MEKIMNTLKSNIKNYFFIAFGVLLVALACNLFIIPIGISAGGVSGIGVIMHQLSGVSVSTVVYIGNAILLVLAFFLIEREVFYRSIFGSFLFPFFLSIIPAYALVPNDTLLAIIVGGALMGLGFGIVFSYGGSTGGTSVVPYFLKKYFNLPMAFGFFLCDALIISLNVLVGSIVGIFYGILCIVIANLVTDYCQNGFSKKKSVYIISEKNDKIQVYIHQTINRGTTLFNITGGYSKDVKTMIMSVVSNNELQKIREYALNIDSSAFIIIGSVTEVHGYGFTLEQKTNEI